MDSICVLEKRGAVKGEISEGGRLEIGKMGFTADSVQLADVQFA